MHVLQMPRERLAAAAQLLSGEPLCMKDTSKGALGPVPGRSGTAAPPRHCLSPQQRTSQPQKPHRTWLPSFRH